MFTQIFSGRDRDSVMTTIGIKVKIIYSGLENFVIILCLLLFTGECVHTMVAHQDAVASVDFDSSGMYLLSGGWLIYHTSFLFVH
jgi:hypothetical protein